MKKLLFLLTVMPLLVRGQTYYCLNFISGGGCNVSVHDTCLPAANNVDVYDGGVIAGPCQTAGGNGFPFNVVGTHAITVTAGGQTANYSVTITGSGGQTLVPVGLNGSCVATNGAPQWTNAVACQTICNNNCTHPVSYVATLGGPSAGAFMTSGPNVGSTTLAPGQCWTVCATNPTPFTLHILYLDCQDDGGNDSVSTSSNAVNNGSSPAGGGGTGSSQNSTTNQPPQPPATNSPPPLPFPTNTPSWNTTGPPATVAGQQAIVQQLGQLMQLDQNLNVAGNATNAAGFAQLANALNGIQSSLTNGALSLTNGTGSGTNIDYRPYWNSLLGMLTNGAAGTNVGVYSNGWFDTNFAGPGGYVDTSGFSNTVARVVPAIPTATPFSFTIPLSAIQVPSGLGTTVGPDDVSLNFADMSFGSSGAMNSFGGASSWVSGLVALFRGFTLAFLTVCFGYWLLRIFGKVGSS